MLEVLFAISFPLSPKSIGLSCPNLKLTILALPLPLPLSCVAYEGGRVLLISSSSSGTSLSAFDMRLCLREPKLKFWRVRLARRYLSPTCVEVLESHSYVGFRCRCVWIWWIQRLRREAESQRSRKSTTKRERRSEKSSKAVICMPDIDWLETDSTSCSTDWCGRVTPLFSIRGIGDNVGVAGDVGAQFSIAANGKADAIPAALSVVCIGTLTEVDQIDRPLGAILLLYFAWRRKIDRWDEHSWV